MISELDYQNMEARLASKRKTPEPMRSTEQAMREADLHQEIIDYCRSKGWIPFHGSMAHSTFRVRGEPDFVLCMDGGKFLLVECKTKTGKLSCYQQGIAAWANKLGHKIHVVRSFEEFLKLL